MDYFVPILPELARDWTVDYIESADAPSSSGKKWISRFLEDGTLASFRVVPSQSQDGSLSFQRKVMDLIKQTKETPFEVLLLGTDFYLFDRYLIALARDLGARVVVLHTNILHPDILRRYLESQGMAHVVKEIHFPKRPFIERAFKRALSITRKNLNRGHVFWDRRVVPALLWKKTFPLGPDDRFTFTSGRADAVLFYDEMDANAYRRAVPAVKNCVVVKHPARTPLPSRKERGHRSKSLLVLFSSYTVEMDQSKIDFWVRVIGETIVLAGLEKVHLRFHPRMRADLTWPGKIKEKLKALPAEVTTVLPTASSLIEIVPDYAGVVGAYSGALRVARAASSEIFVIGMVAGGECCPQEGSWVLGNSEGIVWIEQGEAVRAEHIAVPALVDEGRPTVAEFLKTGLAVAA